jgi:hypothetical protein
VKPVDVVFDATILYGAVGAVIAVNTSLSVLAIGPLNAVTMTV